MLKQVGDSYEAIAKEMEYKKIPFRHGSYKMNKMTPQLGTIVTVPVGGGTETIIPIPSNVINLAKSRVEFTVTPAAGGALTYNYQITLGAVPWQQLQLISKNGTVIQDINYFENFMHTTRFANTKLVNFHNADTGEGFSPLRTAGGATSIEGHLDATVTAADSAVSGMEPRSFSAVGGVNTATPVTNWVFNFSEVFDTLFAMSKDLYFPEELALRIVWGNPNKMLTNGDNAGNPASTPLPFPGSLGITGLYLYAAVQQDPAIRQGLISQVASGGFTMAIPFVKGYKAGTSASTSQVVSQMFGPGDGQTLRRIYNVPMAGPESALTAFKHSQAGAATGISTYNTALNSVKLQEPDLTVTTTSYDDWNYHKWLLAGGVIQNRLMYRRYWMHVDDFTGIPGKGDEQVPAPRDNLIAGIPLIASIRYDLTATTYDAAALIWYMYAVFTKVLHIAPVEAGGVKLG